MNEFEKLLEEVCREIPVIEGSIQALTGYSGLYRNDRIYLDSQKSFREKRCILSEEFGHYKYSVGTLIDYTASGVWKEEWKARRFGIDLLISLDDLLSCALNGCHTKYECAEFLDVTPDFLSDTLVHFLNKYGESYNYRGYKFMFDYESIRVELLEDIQKSPCWEHGLG